MLIIGPTQITRSNSVAPSNSPSRSLESNQEDSNHNTTVVIDEFPGFDSEDTYGSEVVINQIFDFQEPEGAEIVSSVFDIRLVDVNGEEINFDGSATLCFDILNPDQVSKKRSCLSFFNEEKQEWECEDKCLEENENGQFCGSTSHFTDFAILFYGIDGPGAACSSTPNPYIFDAYWKDLIMVASFIGCGVCCFVFFAVISRLPYTERYLLGNEGWRLRQLRSKYSAINSAAQSVRH